MSDNALVISKTKETDISAITDTHHILACILLELGEPWKPKDEKPAASDYIYVATNTWGGLFRQASQLLKLDDLMAKFPEGRYAKTSVPEKVKNPRKTAYEGGAPPLYKKAFVRKLYPHIRDELSKDAVRAQAQQKGRLDEGIMKAVLTRAGFTEFKVNK